MNGHSKSSAPSLRWGILGTARIVRRLVEPIREAGHTLLAVASRTPGRAEAFARQWDIPRAHDSYDALLADSEIDVIYLPLPNALHAAWTVRAAEAGKHVLCEKPLATSVTDVRAMMEAAERHGVVVAEAFMYRHHPATDAAMRLVRDGALGAVRHIRGAFSFTVTREGDVRLDPTLGGGSLWDVGCYPVSWMRTALGAEPIEVSGAAVVGPSGVDLSFFGTLRFQDGVVGQFDSSLQAPNREEIEVIGSEGVLRLSSPFRPGLEEDLIIQRESGIERVHVAGGSLYLGEVEDMARAIHTRAAPRIPLGDSLANVTTILALYESARTGRTVRLGPLH